MNISDDVLNAAVPELGCCRAVSHDSFGHPAETRADHTFGDMAVVRGADGRYERRHASDVARREEKLNGHDALNRVMEMSATDSDVLAFPKSRSDRAR